MIREELYKWLEPEFAVLKLIDFFPSTQDLGNNYVLNFFLQNCDDLRFLFFSDSS